MTTWRPISFRKWRKKRKDRDNKMMNTARDYLKKKKRREKISQMRIEGLKTLRKCSEIDRKSKDMIKLRHRFEVARCNSTAETWESRT